MHVKSIGALLCRSGIVNNSNGVFNFLFMNLTCVILASIMAFLPQKYQYSVSLGCVHIVLSNDDIEACDYSPNYI